MILLPTSHPLVNINTWKMGKKKLQTPPPQKKLDYEFFLGGKGVKEGLGEQVMLHHPITFSGVP